MKSIAFEFSWRSQPPQWSTFTSVNAAKTEHRYGLWMGRLLILITTYNERQK